MAGIHLVRSLDAPIEHAFENGLGAVWDSTFTMPISFAGGPLGAAMAAVFRRGFVSILDEIEARSPQ